MHRILFQAYGHENIIANHRTTLEITREAHLTRRGDCIVGVRSNISLVELGEGIKLLARKPSTRIILKLSVGGMTDEIVGRGSTGLDYSDKNSMVIRKSSFECPRTLMVGANKAAIDLDREFINVINDSNVLIECELVFINQ